SPAPDGRCQCQPSVWSRKMRSVTRAHPLGSGPSVVAPSTCVGEPGHSLTLSQEGRLFPWGKQPAGWGRSNIAHAGSKRGRIYPPLANVDRYEEGRSLYGVYQMAGNVAEWTADWFDP